MTPEPRTPLCALHPDRSAGRTCSRCGSFMCDECGDFGSVDSCPTCRQLVGSFPIRRDTWNFGALWDVAWKAFSREWVMLSVAALLMLMVSGGVSMVGQLFTSVAGVSESYVALGVAALFGFVVQLAGQSVVQLGMTRIALDVLHGRPVDLGRLFSQIHKVPRALLAQLLLMFAVAVPIALLAVPLVLLARGSTVESSTVLGVAVGGGLLLLFPLFYVLMPFALLNPEIVANDRADVLTVLKNCWALADGQRLGIFGVALIAGLCVVAGVLACCVGIFPAMGLYQLLVAGLYLALRTGGPLAPLELER